ncbi:MAG TPA: hypothetical protein VE974_19920 [Thermoanaerobaculia bacterium]|nr:hypothetical protein [Thermoanaerobaculia bacterium]
MKTSLALLITLFAVTAFAQTSADEVAVISASVLHHYSQSQPYITEPVLLGQVTEKLAPAKPNLWTPEALEAYEAANASSIAIAAGIELPENVTIGDVTRYRNTHNGTLVFRIARPAFVSADHAYVRYDFVPHELIPKSTYASTLLELRKHGGQWRVVGGVIPATASAGQ